MAEDEFVATALVAAERVLSPPLSVQRGAALLYQVAVDNRLQVTVDPRMPKRGQSAFQTDLCVFDEVEVNVRIPRVVLEFKKRLTTHDVLTYSAKATRHKWVYPYLRYGLIVADISTLPGRFFTHNSGLDFAVAAASHKNNRLQELFAKLLDQEVAASRRLERIAFREGGAYWFRTEVVVVESAGGTAP